MPQQIVYAANTMDFWRQSINGLVANINFAQANSFNVSGNVIVRGGSVSTLALNVANGMIYGNGYTLFALNAASFIGVANNSRLQNVSFGIPVQLGLTANSTTVTLGQVISINVSVVNSITNTRTDLAASANSVAWAMSQANVSIANASLITSGQLTENFGGTGESSFANGDLLIGNTQSSRLDRASITAGLGFSIIPGKGSLQANLNLAQGSRILVTGPTTVNGAYTISANSYEAATTLAPGIISLVDDFNSTSTSQGVTANAVNTVQARIVANPGVTNAYGRLLVKNVYTTSNYAGFIGSTGNTRYSWSKDSNAAFIRIIAVGGGGGTRNSSTTSASNFRFVHGAGAGSVIMGVWQASDFNLTETVQVGGGGYTANGANGDWTGFLSGQVQAGGGQGSNVTNSAVLTSTSGTRKSDDRARALGGVTLSISYANPLETPLEMNGAPGGLSFNMIGTAVAGSGGSTLFGWGGQGGVVSQTIGAMNAEDGRGYGAGAGGCVLTGTKTPAASGGNGAPGLLIVEQYSKI